MSNHQQWNPVWKGRGMPPLRVNDNELPGGVEENVNVQHCSQHYIDQTPQDMHMQQRGGGKMNEMIKLEFSTQTSGPPLQAFNPMDQSQGVCQQNKTFEVKPMQPWQAIRDIHGVWRYPPPQGWQVPANQWNRQLSTGQESMGLQFMGQQPIGQSTNHMGQLPINQQPMNQMGQQFWGQQSMSQQHMAHQFGGQQSMSQQSVGQQSTNQMGQLSIVQLPMSQQAMIHQQMGHLPMGQQPISQQQVGHHSMGQQPLNQQPMGPRLMTSPAGSWHEEGSYRYINVIPNEQKQRTVRFDPNLPENIIALRRPPPGFPFSPSTKPQRNPTAADHSKLRYQKPNTSHQAAPGQKNITKPFELAGWRGNTSSTSTHGKMNEGRMINIPKAPKMKRQQTEIPGCNIGHRSLESSSDVSQSVGHQSMDLFSSMRSESSIREVNTNDAMDEMITAQEKLVDMLLKRMKLLKKNEAQTESSQGEADILGFTPNECMTPGEKVTWLLNRHSFDGNSQEKNDPQIQVITLSSHGNERRVNQNTEVGEANSTITSNMNIRSSETVYNTEGFNQDEEIKEPMYQWHTLVEQTKVALHGTNMERGQRTNVTPERNIQQPSIMSNTPVVS